LKRLSAGDPRRRVGLIPSRHSHRWTFNVTSLERAPLPAPVSVPPPVDDAELITISLNAAVHQHDGPYEPITVMRVGDFALCRFDHGIGDAHVLVRILAAISASTSVFDARDLPDVRFPMFSAIANAVRTTPAMVARAGLDVARDKARGLLNRAVRETDDARTYARGDNSDTVTTIFCTSSPGYPDRLRRFRGEHHLDMSASALTMYAICKSLCAVAIPVSPTVDVLVDLRRYLPSRRTTWANFQAVSRVGFNSDMTPQDFGEELHHSLTSCRPLVETLAYVTRSRLASRGLRAEHERAWALGQRSPSGEAVVTLSDITRLPEFSHIKWRPGTHPNLAVALPPAGVSEIAILICAPAPNEIQLSATFFSSEFDPRKIREALQMAVHFSESGHELERLFGLANDTEGLC
jgi:hypothetical protein